MSVTVYGFYGSLYTQIVYLALAEKGVEFDRHAVNIGPALENYEPWYARIHRNMVIPTIEHDGAYICESAAIVRYLDATFEGPPLLPADPAAREQALAWVDRISALPLRELSYSRITGVLALLRDRVLMPRRLRILEKNKKKAPELAALYDARIADVRSWISTIAQPAKIEAARTMLEKLLSELDTRLQSADFIIGNNYSLADTMATVLSARMLALKIAELSEYPALAAHYARMKARPHFPKDDIVERIELRRIIKIAIPFLLPRLLAWLVVLVLFALVLAALIGNCEGYGPLAGPPPVT
ncbi:MAG TPA: glutathione S-transferase family protein [Nannocystis exedens]|nr:glutathione S-transferase family protein [Nannocystis exedens]